jgi:membrane protein required for colicin V production
MNPVDVAVVLIVVLSALFGLTRGFVHEVLSGASWIGAVALTWLSGASVGRMVHDTISPFAPSMPAWSGEAFGAIVVFVGSLCFFLAVGHGIAARLVGGIPGVFGRLLGVVLGVARGAFLVGYGYLQIGAVVPADAQVLREARTLPLVEQAAGWVRRLNLPSLSGRAAPPAPGFPAPAPGPTPGLTPAPTPGGKPQGMLFQPATSPT